METNDWSKYWAAYTPVLEAWQSLMLSSMVGLGHASMMWMMMPLRGVQKGSEDSIGDNTVRQLQSLVRRTVDAHERAESLATHAFEASLDAGRRSFREIEAATLDSGTVDLGLLGSSSARRNSTG